MLRSLNGPLCHVQRNPTHLSALAAQLAEVGIDPGPRRRPEFGTATLSLLTTTYTTARHSAKDLPTSSPRRSLICPQPPLRAPRRSYDPQRCLVLHQRPRGLRLCARSTLMVDRSSGPREVLAGLFPLGDMSAQPGNDVNPSTGGHTQDRQTFAGDPVPLLQASSQRRHSACNCSTKGQHTLASTQRSLQTVGLHCCAHRLPLRSPPPKVITMSTNFTKGSTMPSPRCRQPCRHETRYSGDASSTSHKHTCNPRTILSSLSSLSHTQTLTQHTSRGRTSSMFSSVRFPKPFL